MAHQKSQTAQSSHVNRMAWGSFCGSTRAVVGKAAVVGWIISLAGSGLWIYGYFATGHPPVIDWSAHTPWWIAEYLPNIEAEIGMVLAFAGMVPIYWPKGE
jgi:hypothetical protein